MCSKSILILILILEFEQLTNVEAQGKKRLNCPCHFERHNKTFVNDTYVEAGQKTSFMCVAPIPLQAATALNGNDTEANAEVEDAFSVDYVQQACAYYRSEIVAYDSDKDCIADNCKRFPNESLFFIKGDCAYISSETGDFVDRTCFELMKDKYFETVLCQANQTKNVDVYCRCPCGFSYDTNGNCIASISGCEPFGNAEGMYMLSYTVLPTVAVVVRWYGFDKPPDIWPDNAVFFYSDPDIEKLTETKRRNKREVKEGEEEKEGDELYCGFKDGRNGSILTVDTCELLFNHSALFSVLVMAPEESNLTVCPKPAKVSCRANQLVGSSRFFIKLISAWVIAIIVLG